MHGQQNIKIKGISLIFKSPFLLGRPARVDKGATFVRNVGLGQFLPRDTAPHSRRKECSNAVFFVQCCTHNNAEVSQGAQNVPVRKTHPALPGRLLCNPTTVATAVPCGLQWVVPPVVLPCSLASSQLSCTTYMSDMNLSQRRLRAPSALTNTNLSLPKQGIYCCVMSLSGREGGREGERERERTDG